MYPETIFTIIALQYPYKKAVYTWHGMTVHSLDASGLGLGKKIIHWRNTLKLVKSIHASTPIDVIHSFWLHEAFFVASKMSKSLKLPLIASGGGQEVKPGNKYLKYFKSNTCTYVCSSQIQKQLLSDNYGVMSKLIPMGLHTEAVHSISEKTIDILGVGNFTKNKNYASFIQIVGQLTKSIPNLTVKLIGDGEDLKTIQDLIQSNQLSENIELTGMIPRNSVYDLMAKSKILLHPSQYESFGMVYVEALAHGMHVVSKETGIAKTGNTWHIYSSEDEAIDKLNELLNKELVHVSETHYPASVMVDQYKTLYDR